MVSEAVTATEIEEEWLVVNARINNRLQVIIEPVVSMMIEKIAGEVKNA